MLLPTCSEGVVHGLGEKEVHLGHWLSRTRWSSGSGSKVEAGFKKSETEAGSIENMSGDSSPGCGAFYHLGV